MRGKTYLVLVLVSLLCSSCDFSSCSGIRNENELAFQKYLDLRQQRYKEWQNQVVQWEKFMKEEQDRKYAEKQLCLENPVLYYNKSKTKNVVDFFGGYASYTKQFGVDQLCESLQGLGISIGTMPEDDSSSYPPAVEQYVLSMRITKNNPQCFSATEVAKAEQELFRLGSN